MKPLEDTEFFHLDRYGGDYPSRLLGYIPDKAAVLRSLHDGKLYKSVAEAIRKGGYVYCKEGHEISEEEGEKFLENRKAIKTMPYILHPDDWLTFTQQQERFEQGKVQFVWQILEERGFSMIRTLHRDHCPLLFTDREKAEEVFSTECRKFHGYSYSDAVANGDAGAERWKEQRLFFERTEISTWAGCDENGRFRGHCYGWLSRKELYI